MGSQLSPPSYLFPVPGLETWGSPRRRGSSSGAEGAECTPQKLGRSAGLGEDRVKIVKSI